MEDKTEELVKYWIDSAKEDFNVMGSLFKNKHYPYALYFGHLVLEKILKGYYVKTTGKQSPYTHNLSYIAQESKLKLDKKQIVLLEDVTVFNIEARYPKRKFEFYKLCTKEYTEGYLSKIKEFYKWILKKV